MKNNQKLKNQGYDLDYYLKNKDKINEAIKNNLAIQYALLGAGHAIQWAKTTHLGAAIGTAVAGPVGSVVGIVVGGVIGGITLKFLQRKAQKKKKKE